MALGGLSEQRLHPQPRTDEGSISAATQYQADDIPADSHVSFACVQEVHRLHLSLCLVSSQQTEEVITLTDNSALAHSEPRALIILTICLSGPAWTGGIVVIIVCIRILLHLLEFLSGKDLRSWGEHTRARACIFQLISGFIRRKRRTYFETFPRLEWLMQAVHRRRA